MRNKLKSTYVFNKSQRRKAQKCSTKESFQMAYENDVLST